MKYMFELRYYTVESIHLYGVHGWEINALG
jgi:hypothetical protein